MTENFPIKFNINSVEKMRVNNDGNVGIGTTSPSQKLEVNGKVQIDDLTTAGGASALYSVGGVLTTAVSSGRFKENIMPYEDVLSRVGQLSAVRFTWKPGTATPGQADFGFIAEDAAQLFPELATYEADGTTIRGLKYDKLPILLTKAIQEQQGEIDNLKLQLNSEGLLNATSTADIAAQNGGIVAWVTNALQSLGMALKDGVATLQGVVVDTFTARKARVNELEMTDKATGEIYCTWIENGEWIKVKGACDSQTSVPAPLPAQSANEPAPVPTPAPALPPSMISLTITDPVAPVSEPATESTAAPAPELTPAEPASIETPSLASPDPVPAPAPAAAAE
jgi:hypothetical protein